MMIIYHQHHQIQRLISIMIIVMVVFLRVITITSDINISFNANKLYIIFIIIIPYILVINPSISTNQNPPSSFIINIHFFLIIIISFNIFLIQTPLHPNHNLIPSWYPFNVHRLLPNIHQPHLHQQFHFHFNIIHMFIRTHLTNHLDFNSTMLSERITNGVNAFIYSKLLKSPTNHNITNDEGAIINLFEEDTEHIGFMFLMRPRIIIEPFKVVIAVMMLFRLFGKMFVYSCMELCAGVYVL